MNSSPHHFLALLLLAGALGCEEPRVLPTAPAISPQFASGGAQVAVWDITPHDGSDGNWFGNAVAMDGDLAIVGAYRDDSRGEDAGAAYVFSRTSTGWLLEAFLSPADATAGLNFGRSVAIAGELAVVGGPGNLTTHPGEAAYVFSRSGGAWTQEAKLTGLGSPTETRFGDAVSTDGDQVIVSESTSDCCTTSSVAAHVFVRSGVTWTREAVLVADDLDPNDHFGQFGASVRIDGDLVLVGAPLDGQAAHFAGAAYVFSRSEGSWTQEAKLLASDALGNDLFGRSVAASGDVVVVGANQHDPSGVLNAGSAYVFRRSGVGWAEEARIVPLDLIFGGHFGWSLDVEGDGMLVGARATGAAYLFRYSDGAWVQESRLSPRGPSGGHGAFGSAVAVSGDLALVGAPQGVDGSGMLVPGNAFIFDLPLCATRGKDAPDAPGVCNPGG